MKQGRKYTCNLILRCIWILFSWTVLRLNPLWSHFLLLFVIVRTLPSVILLLGSVVIFLGRTYICWHRSSWCQILSVMVKTVPLHAKQAQKGGRGTALTILLTLTTWPLGKIAGTHFTGGWVGLETGLDGYGKSHSGIWNPRPSNLWCVAIPTVVSHPPVYQSYTTKSSTLLKCFVIADVETIFHISKSVLALSKAFIHVHACSPWHYTCFMHIHQLSSYCCSTLHLHKFSHTVYCNILPWLQ